MIDRTKPPVETETTLLSGLMEDNTRIADVAHMLSASDFHDPGLGRIYREIVAMWSRGEEANPVTVLAGLPDRLRDMVSDVATWAPYGHQATFYANQVKEASVRRHGVAECKAIAAVFREDDRELVDVLGEAQGRILRLGVDGTEPDLPAVLADVTTESDEAAARPSGVIGVPYGFRKLDMLTGGMIKPDLIVVACRPSVGKTSFGLNVAEFVIRRQREVVAFFSAEMSRRALALRMISGWSGIDSMKIRSGRLSKSEVKARDKARDDIAAAAKGRLLVDDRSSPTVPYITSVCRRLAQQAGRLDLVIIDYFQLMGSERRYQRELEMYNERSKLVKDMAKALDVPVMLLTQLRRSAEEGGENTVPKLTDIKDTGNIEQDADLVISPHRRTRDAEYGEMYVLKHRNGQVGKVPASYRYNAPTTKWEEM